MEDFFSTAGPYLAAAAGFVGLKGLAYLVLGMWFGDWMGRKFPQSWAWLRKGVKQAGDSIKG